MERDDLHREVYRTQGKLTSCFGYDAMGRKAWQFASTLPADKLSQVHNNGINTSLLVEHAYNTIHRRYQYDPAGELVCTLDKLAGKIPYAFEANGQLHSRDPGSLITVKNSATTRRPTAWPSLASTPADLAPPLPSGNRTERPVFCISIH